MAGVTTDHGVLELFEKRVRSRLHNHHVSFTRATAVDVADLFDDRLRVDERALRAAEARLAALSQNAEAGSDDPGAPEYVAAWAAAWAAVRVSAPVQTCIREGVEAGRSMRWFCRVATRAAMFCDRAELEETTSFARRWNAGVVLF